MKPTILVIITSLFIFRSAVAQKTIHYDLQDLLQKNGFEQYDKMKVKAISSPKKGAVVASGYVFLKDLKLSNGIIEADLKGKDLYQQNFLGIAFHAKDTSNYEVIYFRPFNFRTTDSVRHRHAIQYMYMPEYPWDRLRKEHPDAYEAKIQPPPMPEEWFHVKIILKDEWISVYINGSDTPALQVQSLNKDRTGKIGLWTDPGEPTKSEFADLSVSQ